MRSFKDIIYGWFWKYLTKTGLVMCIDLGGDAPEPDPLIGQAAKDNAALGKESLDFYKSVYETDLRPMQKEQMTLAKGLVTDYLTDRQTQRDFAARQNAYYEDTYQPIERRMAQEAMDYDSAGNIARRQGIAAASTNQQFSNARDQGVRALTRMGVNPNSGAFARANDRLTNAQALASAGAQTGAAFDTIDRGIALRAGVANFGRNMPNTAAQYFGLANQTGGMASNVSAQQMDAARANAGMVGQGFNTAISGNQSAGNLMLGDFQGRMQGYQADQQAMSGLFQGLGMLGGASLGMPPLKRAKGGEVEGPGTSTSDSIPAMLSDGEYVINAAAVKKVGTDFLDKINKMGLKGN